MYESERECMRSHARLVKLGLHRDPISATHLLQAYAGLPYPDALAHACRVFAEVPSASRDPSLWAAMISAYARSHPTAHHALRLFAHMPRPNAFACASAARAAGSAADPRLAPAVHSIAIRRGLHSNIVTATAILDMYSKCDDVGSARSVFDEMPERNAVTWNSMISCYTTAGMGIEALELFYRLKCREPELGVDEFLTASSLTASAGLGELRLGVQIHAYIITTGLEFDIAVINALANMYVRCGEVKSAERVIERVEESVITKLMMIKGYVFSERYNDAIKRIHHGTNFVELAVTDTSVLVSVLTACASLELLYVGRQLHGLIVTMGLIKNSSFSNMDVVVLGNALIDMYFKCYSIREATTFFNSLLEKRASHWNSMIVGCIHNGLLKEAREFFDVMPDRGLISWTAMMTGYVRFGLPRETLRLFARLYNDSGPRRGNCFTFATALNACSCLAALNAGKQIHAHALRTMPSAEGDHIVQRTALVDMYAKSGNLNYAQKVFDRMKNKNVVSWTSMITGYAAHGLGLQAINLLEQMMSLAFKPNEITFLSVLSACDHCGLVEEGLHYLKLMSEQYGIAIGNDHISCLVDMLGRDGKLEEAWNLVEEMKSVEQRHGKMDIINDRLESDTIWGALLGGCKLHGNVKIGSLVARKMVERKHQSTDTLVTLSNVYASAEMWNEVYKVREKWRSQDAMEEPGHSRILVETLG